MNKKILLFLIFLIIPLAQSLTLEIQNTEPAPITAGTWADVTVLLTSTQQEKVLEDVTLTLLPNNNILTLGNNQYQIQSIGPGDRYTRTFRIFVNENTPTSNLELNFQITHQETTRSISREIFVIQQETLPNLFIGRANTIPADIVRDSDNNQLILTLQNLGDRTAYLLTAQIISSDIKESNAFSLRDSIASISRGEQQELQFTFNVEDTDKQSLNLILSLNYQIRDAHGNFRTVTESLDFDLTLKQVPKIRVLETEPQNTLRLGQDSNKKTITLINEGEDARNVRLRIFSDVSYPFDFTRTNYFVSSQMKKGEQATITIDFDILNSGEIRNYPVNIEIESSVGTARYMQDDRIDINVTGQASNTQQMLRTTFLIISLIIAISFGIRKYFYKND